MPYRRPDESTTLYDHDAVDAGDAALLPVFALLWLVSVASCALRIARGEPLDGEAALAALLVLALPWIAIRHIKER